MGAQENTIESPEPTEQALANASTPTAIVTAPDAAPQEVYPETLDVAQVKSMLDLPATATDIELITVLVNLVANLQEKYEGLLADAVALEDNLTNRVLEDYRDVIEPTAEAFWRNQLLENRTSAIEALESIRNRIPVTPEVIAPPEPDNRVIPMRNRLAAIERTVETVAEEKPDPVANRVAFKIRNRAHEIARAENIPFIVAFDRATREINQNGEHP